MQEVRYGQLSCSRTSTVVNSAASNANNAIASASATAPDTANLNSNNSEVNSLASESQS
ncbi:hypothetical protein ACYATO_00085 [Lactobacillaceae bacterium Melli_B3]